MKSVLTVVVLVVLGAVALRLLVLALEPRAAFFPLRGEQETPAEYGLEYERVALRTADGETVAAWWIPGPADAPEILFLHGNGGNLSLWSDVIAGIGREGWSVFALDYRGYGLSTGAPSEQGLYRDADAFLEEFWARRHRPGRPVIYWGRSLGATVAAYMTTRRRPSALVLEAPFYSARTLISGDPVMWLLARFMSYRLETAAFLRGFPGPTLIVHGDADRIVPLRQGRRVFDALGGAKRMAVVPGAGHNDLHVASPDLYWRELRRFVADPAEGSSLE